MRHKVPVESCVNSIGWIGTKNEKRYFRLRYPDGISVLTRYNWLTYKMHVSTMAQGLPLSSNKSTIGTTHLPGYDSVGHRPIGQSWSQMETSIPLIKDWFHLKYPLHTLPECFGNRECRARDQDRCYCASTWRKNSIFLRRYQIKT